jgi:hypothetical protein
LHGRSRLPARAPLGKRLSPAPVTMSPGA